MGDAMPADAFIGSANPANGSYQMKLAYVVLPELPSTTFAGLAALTFN